MNEIMPFETTWMDLKDILLSEISQTEKDKYHIISLICGIKNKQIKNKNQANRYREKIGGYQTWVLGSG